LIMGRVGRKDMLGRSSNYAGDFWSIFFKTAAGQKQRFSLIF
jgi:hypothetical protein